MKITKSDISLFENYIDRTAQAIFWSKANEMAMPYFQVVKTITSIREEIESFTEETTAAESFLAVSKHIEESNLEEWPTALRQGAKDLGSVLVDFYDIQLNGIFNKSAFKNEKAKYKLSIDQRSMEISKTKNNVLEQLQPLFIKLQELQAKRRWLVSHMPHIKEITDEKFDIFSAIKTVLGGLVTTVNPFYGLTTLFLHGANEYNKRKASNHLVNQFDISFSEYHKDIISVLEIVQSSLHEANEYFTQKFRQINYDAVFTILQHIESAGGDVQYYFDGLKSEIPLLEDAETKLGIRKTARKRSKALTNRVKKTPPKSQTRKPAKKNTARKTVKKK